MSINGIMNSVSAPVQETYSQKTNTKSNSTNTDNKTSQSNDTAAVYEPSSTVTKDAVKATKNNYKQNTALVEKLKADQEQRTAQFRQMVESMLTKQGKTFQNADSMWKILASGNFTVDRATALQAQKDIADDGYWGVEQTSDRILSFAEALSGGDPEKMEKMRAAFIKGYKQATGAWGRDLPDISSKTYDAVMKKFDDYASKNKEDDSVTELEK
ncbi:MAG: hypothetical protein HFI05_13280 [Lachnospiraceae bacterium]|jgi:hypothetical protein|nr:hypothetical protein [Lachnospiraceae bacterium]